ncbi:MAG: DUF465 domain-containing protein [Sphingobium sp.]
MSIFPYKLTQLHTRLDDHIRAEMTRLIPDSLRLLRLKRLRLTVKGRLTARILQLQLS